MASKNKLAKVLYKIGSKLGLEFISREKVLGTLIELEGCLAIVDQSPSNLLQTTLVPTVIGLNQHKWLKHSDGKVKLLVASCLMEVIRILAPQEPYKEDIMKEVVELIVDSFQNLGESSSCHFPRRAAILKSFANIRLCNGQPTT